MSASSSNPTETTTQAASPVDSLCVRDRVVEIANQSTDRTEFLKHLAADLQANFPVAIIAIQASHWPSPMMLVTDDLLSAQVERDAIRDLLMTATPRPIGCSVPVKQGYGVKAVRAMRVELTDVPERSALLMIYPNQHASTPEVVIEDLRQLGLYGEAARSVVQQVPIHGEQETPTKSLPATAEDPASTRVSSLRLFHLDLDLDGTSYRIVNESRRLIGCDRVTLLVPRAAGYRVSAVSGVSVVDRRSNSVRATERLAEAAVVISRPLFFPSKEPLPPQIQQPLDNYLDETGVMSAMLIPLYAPRDCDESSGIEFAQQDSLASDSAAIGVIVLEFFSGEAPASLGPTMGPVAVEAALALRNAQEHQQVFGLRLWKSVGKLLQMARRPLATALILGAIGLLIASMFIQIDHYTIATGNLEPATRREVFASVDGIVKKLHVQDGQRVQAGTPLLQLENAELESQAEALSGEIQTATQRLGSIQAVRLSQSADPSQSSRLALEERQLRSELANLQAQQEIVRAQQKELLITSPIEGTVIGWQLDQRLTERPVARGNRLLSIVDHDGEWSLRLKIPDRNAGPVLEAIKAEPQLPISFAVATQPKASFGAKLQSIATAARVDELGEHVIDAIALVGHSGPENGTPDPFDVADMRAGADVTAKIACGQRSVLRSWFGDVFDFFHRNILFYL